MKVLRNIGTMAFVLGLFTAVFVGIPCHVVVADDPVVPWWLKIAVFCLLVMLRRRPASGLALLISFYYLWQKFREDEATHMLTAMCLTEGTVRCLMQVPRWSVWAPNCSLCETPFR